MAGGAPAPDDVRNKYERQKAKVRLLPPWQRVPELEQEAGGGQLRQGCRGVGRRAREKGWMCTGGAGHSQAAALPCLAGASPRLRMGHEAAQQLEQGPSGTHHAYGVCELVWARLGTVEARSEAAEQLAACLALAAAAVVTTAGCLGCPLAGAAACGHRALSKGTQQLQQMSEQGPMRTPAMGGAQRAGSFCYICDHRAVALKLERVQR